jgi:hypothetical protein
MQVGVVFDVSLGGWGASLGPRQVSVPVPVRASVVPRCSPLFGVRRGFSLWDFREGLADGT